MTSDRAALESNPALEGSNDGWLLTIDQSTTATKALLIDGRGKIGCKHAIPHRQIYPRDGWVEHDPVEIYANVKTAIRAVLEQAGVDPTSLRGLTLTNQRETAVLWDRKTGLPVGNAIVWQCRRTADFCDWLKREGHEPQVRAKTGLLLDPYFSAAKWRWLIDHVPAGLPADRLLAGTIDSWLIWKLTGGQVHATDYSNASRTQLFNIHTLQWDEELSALFGVPLDLLPDVRGSDCIYGQTAEPELFPVPVPIAGVVGDSQGALFGQQCTVPGMAKGTYGTGTSVLLFAGGKPETAANGLVTTVAWGLGGHVAYAIEAIIHSTGDSLNWVRDQLGLFRTYAELEASVAEAGDSGGVYLVPAFVGLGAPYWNPRARAAMMGMNRSTDRRHIMRAALESIAYQVADAVRLLEQQTGVALTELRVDGGATANGMLMQFQADLLNVPVRRPAAAELSALGSAYLGGLGLGLWNMGDIAGFHETDRMFPPEMDEAQRADKMRGWHAAVEGVLTAEQSLHRKEDNRE